MSRNFELLQQIGDVDVFRTTDESKVEARLNSESTKLVRERILRDASLPDAFEISGVSAGETLALENGEHAVNPDVYPQTVQQHFDKWSSSFTRWIDSLRVSVKSLEHKRITQKRRHRAELQAIAREEEVKLVQKVFPGTNQSTQRVAVFAGLESDSECSVICARTGEILATRAEGPVCVVDANFHSPDLHRCFGTGNEKGLAEAALEAGPVQNFAQRIAESNLWLMPTGNAGSRINFPASAESLRARISELREAFRYVVVRSGPLRLDANAMFLSRWTDGVVLVLEANSTRRELAWRVKENLESANVRLLGVVLNNQEYHAPNGFHHRF